MRFAIFPVHLSKVLRLPRKIDARSYEVLRLSRKIILANLHIWYSKMQPLSGNERPDLLTSHEHVFSTAPATKMHLCRSSSNVPCLPSFLEMLQNPHVFGHFWQGAQSLAPATWNDIWTSKSGANMWCFCTFWLRNVLRATTACTFSTSQLPKVVRTWCACAFWLGNVLCATTACTFSTSQVPKVVRTPSAFNVLTWKCALRHNGVHFFYISTSKCGPNVVCFVHFDLEMCFLPQRRALFQHLNFQKWSDNGVFWCVLCILTSKCASRHNGVQFFISPLARWLRARRFSEPTFRPSGATNRWKNTVNRDFPTFSRISIFFLLTLSLLLFSLLIFLFSLPLPCSAFHLSILSEVWLLNFLRSHIVT